MHQTIQQLTHTLDALHVGAVLIDRAGQIVYANDRLAAVTGRAPAQLLNQPLKELCRRPTATYQGRADLVDFHEPQEIELELRHADGGKVPVIASGRPLGDDPPAAEFRLVTFTEISFQKEAYSHVANLSDTILEQALELKQHSQVLERRVRQRTADLLKANMDAIHMLAVASEARDADTGAHVLRIQHYAQSVAEKFGLDESESERIGYSAVPHDVGKIHVPDQILKKPGPLTSQERTAIQSHAAAGEAILSRQPFFATARQIARSHHENWDGSGYPDGLAADAIPLPARIVHLVDVFDALSSDRVYKSAWPIEQAAHAIQSASGQQFDPELVGAFNSLYHAGKIQQIRQTQSA
ncbi:MAG: two-component system response regulator [Planctomycetaceae bacterium]|nr:two-component system response regulator [Planctomycetaceae bacterium]